MHRLPRILLTQLAAVLALGLPTEARADFAHPVPGEIAIRDVPGSSRHWQEARSLVAAPPEAVRRWLTEYEFWPARFRDVVSVRVLERRGGDTRFAMRSRIMEREVVLQSHVDARGIFYEARDGNVHAWGRIYVSPTPGGGSDVIMQSSAHISGILGVVAPAGLVRERAEKKLTSDLSDLQRLAQRRSVVTDEAQEASR